MNNVGCHPESAAKEPRLGCLTKKLGGYVKIEIYVYAFKFIAF